MAQATQECTRPIPDRSADLPPPGNAASAADRSALATRPAWHSVRWLLAAVFVGLLLRLHCLAFPYLWLDEYTTLWSIGGETYAEMLDRALHWTASGPLFVLLFRASCDLVGDVEWGLKLPAVLSGTLTIAAAWWTARTLFQRDDVALSAAWLVAIAPQFVNFSQEARPYMPAVLLAMLALGCTASWIRTGRRGPLAMMVLCSLGAVGMQLVAALALVAQNTAVILHGVTNRWPRRRWFDWFVAQALVACGLWLVGVQFLLLSARHGSMIFETTLAMPTRQLLDRALRDEMWSEVGFVLAGLALACCGRRFPETTVAKAWRSHSASLRLAGAAYVVPTVLLSVLARLRVLDCWPRYYFLFHAGLMLVLAWVVVCPFPRHLARWLAAAVGISMILQYNMVGGVPSCRLNARWIDLARAHADLRSRLGPDDLVISRAGLIEANQVAFLSDPVGTNYLSCLLLEPNGPLPGKHIALPFSPETEQTARYLESVARETLVNRTDFWLVNVGPGDYDYRDWIWNRFGGQFQKVEEITYELLVLSHYRQPTGGLHDPQRPSVKKGTSDSINATVSKAPCQRSELESD